MALNFYRYKIFVAFKSVTFDQIFLQIIIDSKNNAFWAFFKNFKSDTFESDKKCVTFEKFLIFMENTILASSPTLSMIFKENSKVTLLKITKILYL